MSDSNAEDPVEQIARSVDAIESEVGGLSGKLDGIEIEMGHIRRLLQDIAEALDQGQESPGSS